MNKKALAYKVKKILILVGIPVIAMSIIFVIMGINTLKQQRYLRTVCTEQTGGIVYDFKVTGTETYDNEDGYTDNRIYLPMFKYEVADVTYTSESDFGTAKKRFKLGQEVIVNYNPDNPVDSYVPEDKGGESGPYFLFGLAGILSGLYIFAFIRIFILNKFG